MSGLFSVVKSGQTFAGGAVPTSGEVNLWRSTSQICTCSKNTPLFRNRYQSDTHYIVPINCYRKMLSWKFLKHRNSKLERHVNKISDSDRPPFAATRRDKCRWQTSKCMWDSCFSIYVEPVWWEKVYLSACTFHTWSKS